MFDSPPLRLTLGLAGPLVDEGRLPLSELQRVTTQLRTTLRDVAIVLSHHGPSGRGGRVKKVIEEAVDLNVVGSPRAGSFVLELEAPSSSQSDQDALFVAFGPELVERSVVAFVSGLDALNDELEQLPEGFDRGVLEAVARFSRTFNRGIDEVSFRVANGHPRQPAGARLTPDRVSVVKRLIKKPIRARAVVEGTLRMVDDRTLECRVERPPEISVVCFFDEKDRDIVWEAGRGRQWVRVTGEGEFYPGEKEPRKMWASSIEVVAEQLPFDPGAFWHRRDLAKLAKEQGVKKAHFAALSDPWRDDDEAEALIAAIRGDS
jgi:hypothetical protein